MNHNLLRAPTGDILSLLDWNSLLSGLTDVIHLEKTRETLGESLFFKDRKTIEKEYDSLDFFLASFETLYQEVTLSLSLLPPEKNHLQFEQYLQKSQILSLDDLNFPCNLLEIFLNLRRPLKSWNKLTQFSPDEGQLQSLKHKFIKPFRSFVDQIGKIDYLKHPDLKRTWEKVLEVESEIRQSIVRMSRSKTFSDALQYSEHDIINDRYVLAVKSDSYKASLGNIIAHSKSGLTLFVEPTVLREKSTKRIHLLAEIDEIKNRLARQFSDILRKFIPELSGLIEFVTELDLLRAKSVYCHRNDLTRPSLSDEFAFTLEDFYHPLIEHPVKNTISLEKSRKGFILSGPNTGGKTVALKSIAICHLFLHMGLFLPVSRATIHPVRGIYYFGNDQQNLDEGLSSFASESKNYLELLDSLEESSLIIIDEIFNSTSSEEASSLAIALLDEIHKKSNSKVVISTHHQFFKTHIHSMKEYVSAHVEFDVEIERPTFRISSGSPGSSMAFRIFELISSAMGKTNLIAQTARNIIDKKTLSYEQLLQELSQKQGELTRLIRENKILNNELKNQKKSMEGILLMEKQRMIEGYEKKLEKILTRARTLVSDIKLGQLKTPNKVAEKSHSIRSNIQIEKEELFESKNPDCHYEERVPKEHEFEEQTIYYSTTLKNNVLVFSIDKRKKEAVVHLGKMSLKCPLSTLRILKDKKKTKKQTGVWINIQKEPINKLSLDCRGMRLSEFQNEVESSLQDILIGNTPFVEIIHGHGNGVLKNWLRSYIDENERLIWDSSHGNDGYTKITLK